MGHNQTYLPGSMYCVTLDVSPGAAPPGPPKRVNQVGRGADVRIASPYAVEEFLCRAPGFQPHNMCVMDVAAVVREVEGGPASFERVGRVEGVTLD